MWQNKQDRLNKNRGKQGVIKNAEHQHQLLFTHYILMHNTTLTYEEQSFSTNHHRGVFNKVSYKNQYVQNLALNDK